MLRGPATTEVLDSLLRVAGEPPIVLGDELVPYCEHAAADAAAPPVDIDTERVGPGGHRFFAPPLPQVPAGAGQGNAHTATRTRCAATA
ncbi:hypothetical protein [Streptomyces bacillaris]|uniref:hypothetical protein n=1 Tax=Streptomyces bacillaris TaxID=68179 RepID=UPI0010085E22